MKNLSFSVFISSLPVTWSYTTKYIPTSFGTGPILTKDSLIGLLSIPWSKDCSKYFKYLTVYSDGSINKPQLAGLCDSLFNLRAH